MNWDCLHEAAHAFCARYYGYRVTKCTHNDVYWRQPKVRSLFDPGLARLLTILAAGTVLCEMFGDLYGTGRYDLRRSVAILQAAKAQELLPPILAARADARALILANITAIQAVARELFEKGSLTQAEIDAAVVAAT